MTAALTPSAIAGCDASADVSVLIYPSEPVLTDQRILVMLHLYYQQ
ncbi:MAG: hypothetical protein IPG00_13110 [Saprospiraceae bacterium]|nr:hypothetical protein [Saprospiraceae bacterium]